MTNIINRQMTLRRYPDGMPRMEDFAVTEAEVPDIGEDQVLCRAIYLTVDPYIRVHLNARLAKGYARLLPIGGVIPGEAVLRVERSRFAGLTEGDYVAGFGGWQDYCALPGASLRRVDPRLAPLSTQLGALGMPGLTAYAGFTRLADAQPGQTVFVSAALGGVGAVVGQLARARGCRTVGVSSSAEKCRYAVETLGYDACLDRTRPDFADAVEKTCPEKIDVNFENAGGDVFWAAVRSMRDYGRVIMCGLISDYNNAALPAGPDMTSTLLRQIALKRLVIKGLMVADFFGLYPEFQQEVGAMIRDGRFTHREHIVEGMDNAGRAMIDMMQGRNFGKTVVRVTDDPTL
jgi:NADPH-dependent curcumin reductase CurA